MTPKKPLTRLNTILAHAWMVRTFLKHADEIQESEEMLDVPRTLYDSIRAVEPAFQRGDLADFLRRLKGKLSKLRRAADYFARTLQDVLAAHELRDGSRVAHGVVKQMEEIFAAVDWDAVNATRKSRRRPG